MSKNKESENIFQELQLIREKEGLTLEYIAKDSRIQIDYLKYIESGEFEKLPDVYDKLFFQTYLSYLKVENPEYYLDEFKKLRKELYYPTPTTTIRQIQSKELQVHPIFNLKTMFFAIPAILIITLVIFLISNTQIADDNQADVRELPVRQIADTLKKAYFQDTKKDTSDVIKSIVSVNISAVDTTWLRFIKDNKDTVEYTLYIGNKLDISADSSLRFIIGNAGGLNFIINDSSYGIIGKPGEVITSMLITPRGIAFKRIKTQATL